MHKELLCNEDNLNNESINNAMFNLNDVMDDMKGLKAILEPLNEPDAHELTSELFVSHIIRSLESFISDINDVHNYLDRICLNSIKISDAADKEISPLNASAVLCDNCDKAKSTGSQKELDSICRTCPVGSLTEGRC